MEGILSERLYINLWEEKYNKEYKEV